MASYENNQADRRVQSIGALEAGVRFAGVYEIVRLLGEGGMGRVYLAHDMRSGGREVALKILHPGKTGPGLTLGEGGVTLGSLGGQSPEARFLASLEHPSMLPVYDAGVDPSTGLAYFTMRACLLSRDEMARICDEVLRCPYPRDRARWDAGPSALTLRDILKGGKVLPEAAVARIGMDIVEALSCTHVRKPPIVHRDIKPSNILFDATGRAILSDFGIAKESRVSGENGRKVFAGTPAYASPEQKEGVEAIPASDYYSLGVVLHEALTGERVVGSAAPSSFDRGRISHRWDSLLARLLANEPDTRLSDPGEVKRALRGIARGTFSRRRCAMIAVAIVAVAVAAVVMAFGVRDLSLASGSGFGSVGIRVTPPPVSDPPALSPAERAEDVRRKVELLRAGPEWPIPARPWFPDILFPPRPENNRRHFEGAVFEMLLPDGTPMQFASMALELDRMFDYASGCFKEADGSQNMSKDEREAMRTVVSKRLLFSRTEVTREQFAAVMSATNPVPLREMTVSDWTNAPAAMARTGMGPKEFGSRLRYYKARADAYGRDFFASCYTSVFIRVSQETPPQNGVPAADGIRFADVERFVAKLNSLCPPGCVFRLPTEAEWEAACRADSERRFEGESPDDVCWSRENSGGAPHAVAQKKQNFLGLFDLHGNVAEWCLDGFGPLVRPAFDPLIPVPADGSHVVRGGSWEDPVEECGSECRRAGSPDETGIGIRLVLEY